MFKQAPPPEPIRVAPFKHPVNQCPYCDSVQETGWLNCHHCGAPNRNPASISKYDSGAEWKADSKYIMKILM